MKNAAHPVQKTACTLQASAFFSFFGTRSALRSWRKKPADCKKPAGYRSKSYPRFLLTDYIGFSPISKQ
jgi:hypothetical protein